MDNLRRIRDSFNQAAKSYDEHNEVQIAVGKTLITTLKHYCMPPQAIIDLGCGSGFITEHLIKAIRAETFYAIDIAPDLLAKAKERLAEYPIIFNMQSFDELNEKEKYDVIFSNMALQWSYSFEQLLKQIAQALRGSGLLAFTIPLAGTFAELPAGSRNAFFTLQEIQIFLEKNGFELLNAAQLRHQLSFPSGCEALASIKSLGANYLIKGSQGFKHITSLKKLLKTSPFNLTYEIGVFIAAKRGSR